MMATKKHPKLALAVCFCFAALLQAAEINVAELGLAPDGKNDFAGILEKVMETIQPETPSTSPPESTTSPATW